MVKRKKIKIVLIVIGIIVLCNGVGAYIVSQNLPELMTLKGTSIAKKYPSKDYQNKILLVGSSFIERWKTSKEDLAPLDTVNLAIGGTNVESWEKLYSKLIVPYKPKAIVFYVGSNDIDGSKRSKTGDETFALIKQLFTNIEAELGQVPIYYISIAPTIKRENVWKDSNRCNELMKEYCKEKNNLHFIDCTQALLNSDGSLKKDIYGKDKLHFNENGYKIWAPIIREELNRQYGNK